MRFTLAFAIDKFKKFNILIFKSQLPQIPIRLSDAVGFLGLFVTRNTHSPSGPAHGSKYEFRFSRAYDLPEEELEDTIIHEMIHYYIAYTGQRDNAPHGRVFRKIMTDINTRFNRHLTISHRLSREEAMKVKCSRRKWHVIAIGELTDGHTILKVLPRVIPKIIKFHEAMSRGFDLNSIDLYLSDAPEFNIYPVSTANKFHIINPDEIRPLLANATRLYVEDGKLVQR